MKHSKWVGLGIAALCAGLIVGCGGKPTKEQAAQAAAKELSKNLPTKLDSITTLTKAEANNGNLNLYYTLSNPDAKEHAAEAEEGMRATIVDTYCNNDQNKQVREMQIEVTHNYVDSTGAQLFTIKVNPTMCKK